jgi:hypothetical protein
MSDARVAANSPTQVLKQDDWNVEQLFAEYMKVEEGDPSESRCLFQEISEALTIHTGIEERVSYPPDRDEWTEEAEDVLNEAVEEHQLVKTLLEEMSGFEAEDEQFEATKRVLRENLEPQVDEEE